MPDSVADFLKDLDGEQAQEERVRDHEDSFFATAPDSETIVTRAREFDDLEKHLVRSEIWLTTAKALYKEKKSGLRLLTLPGRHRLEIEHYKKNGLLDITSNKDTNDSELSAVGFETSPEVFGLLRTITPRFSHLFQADLVKTLSDPSATYHNQLKRLFPFDIVNLDLTANLVSPKDGPYGPVLKAISESLRLQAAQPGQWALMLTFRIGQGATDLQTIEELSNQFQDNITQHPQFKQACFERHNLVDAKAIYQKNSDEALGLFAAKWIVDQAHVYNWKVVDLRQVHYARAFTTSQESGVYCIKKLVFRFQRGSVPSYAIPSKQLPVLDWHIEDLTNVAKSASVDFSEKFQALERKQAAYIETLRHELESLKGLTS